jgi:hypothetical protein
MSGFGEVAAVFGFVAASVELVKVALEIYEAVEDPSKIPKKLRKVAEKLPAVRDLLETAQEQYDNELPDKKTWQEAEASLKRCHDGCEELKQLFDKALPQQDTLRGRVWTGFKVAVTSKGKKAEDLLEEISQELEILVKRHILTDSALLADIKTSVEELCVRSDGRYQHHGSGAQNIIEGSRNNIYSQSGEGNRQVNVSGSGGYYEAGAGTAAQLPR